MTSSDNDKPVTKPEAPTKAREAYEPPAVVSEEVFETLALSCLKVSQGACDDPPPSS